MFLVFTWSFYYISDLHYLGYCAINWIKTLIMYFIGIFHQYVRKNFPINLFFRFMGLSFQDYS